MAAAALALLAVGCGDDDDGPPIPPPGSCPEPESAPHVVELDASADYTMALMSDGTTRCWGLNVANRCAVDSSTVIVWPPQQSQGLTCATQISLGEEGGAARRADGALLVWS